MLSVLRNFKEWQHSLYTSSSHLLHLQTDAQSYETLGRGAPRTPEGVQWLPQIQKVNKPVAIAVGRSTKKFLLSIMSGVEVLHKDGLLTNLFQSKNDGAQSTVRKVPSE